MPDDLVILGRKIGTSDGWDQLDYGIDTHYKFDPIDELKQILPMGDLVINYNGGYFEYNDSEGNVTESVDIIDTLKTLKRT